MIIQKKKKNRLKVPGTRKSTGRKNTEIIDSESESTNDPEKSIDSRIDCAYSRKSSLI